MGRFFPNKSLYLDGGTMQIYLDNDKNTVTFVQSVASASTMISSLANEASQFVLSKFPKNYFKHVFIDTSQTVTQRAYNEKYSKTANKIRYPSMTITPVMSLDDPIGGMEKSMHMSSPNLYLRRDIDRTMGRIVVDPKNRFAVYYSSDYITTNFDFKITVNTYIQNVNASMYMKSRFQPGFFQYYNNRKIETEIPKSLIVAMSDILGYDMSNSDDMDALRLYLIGTGKTVDSVLKKINTGTSKECFFLNKEQNLLVLMNDLDCPPSVIKDGQSEGEYTITFRLQISTWIPNAFILKMNKDKIASLNKTTISALENSESSDLSEGILTTKVYEALPVLLGDVIEFTDDSGNTQIGHLIFKETYTRPMDGSSIGTLYAMQSINSKLKDEFTKVLDYAISSNIDLSALIHIRVFSNQGEISNALFSFDYSTLGVTLLNESYVQSDIGIAMYINRLAYESLLKAVSESKFYFNSNFLTTVKSKVIEDNSEKNVDIAVHSFASSRERLSSDDAMCFRINTAYGIGYIGLSDPDDSEENSYRICIGFDSDNNAIIKQFELRESS